MTSIRVLILRAPYRFFAFRGAQSFATDRIVFLRSASRPNPLSTSRIADGHSEEKAAHTAGSMNYKPRVVGPKGDWIASLPPLGFAPGFSRSLFRMHPGRHTGQGAPHRRFPDY